MIILLVLFLLALAEPAAAQLRLETQAALASRYVWRGITRASRWSVLPQMGFGWKGRGVALDAGLAGAVELGDGEALDRSQVGVPGTGLGELDLWAAGSLYDGATAIRFGFIRYTYHGRATRGGVDSRSNTSELWAALDLRREPLSPRLDLFYDVDRVRGLYLTASAAVPLIAFPSEPYTRLYVEADVGVNLSQEADPNDSGSGYFEDTGPTHTRIALRLPFLQRDGFTWSAAYFVQLGFDRATRAGLDGDPGRGRLTHVVEMRVAYFATAVRR